MAFLVAERNDVNTDIARAGIVSPRTFQVIDCRMSDDEEPIMMSYAEVSTSFTHATLWLQ